MRPLLFAAVCTVAIVQSAPHTAEVKDEDRGVEAAARTIDPTTSATVNADQLLTGVEAAQSEVAKGTNDDDDADDVKLLTEDIESDSKAKDDKPLLFPAVTGQRCVKSQYNAYLRGWDNGTDWHVGAVPQCGRCEQWTIEEHDGKVSLKESCTGKYLRANIEWYVDLANEAKENEVWTPIANFDWTWSFKSAHGTYLRAQPHGRISLQTRASGDESFTLQDWKGTHITSKIEIQTNISRAEPFNVYLLKTYGRRKVCRACI
ncbi:hypothetical protein PMAYCL1PPCAC_21361 [Pristionchus mayeri]|uniref:Uncharacterized protein n=1 Tax=Pristionchus mayeri TaxID=1317129 RepID=A0AAN5I578_9BILA|nr:hypothetical protein PMAYCL1PPCAC_21361 [Pristionchus mayeri]